MRTRIQPWFIVVLVFMGIGLVSSFAQRSTESWLIPVVLVSIVFLLYKFPPTRWRNPPSRGRTQGRGPRPDFRRTAAKADKRRTSPFTVIEGRKNKEDEPPRYH
ncbi:hypothetical protein [Cohnella abietis]|uniref:Uncharacterized protein n=1 Tax=Cohnella abietis TaxID=2507935 RepID=A0A3T1D4U1_9BACL|nr:hypothetical protein [Cohnella abietis]BBI33058.1 hypothetical protein KCTCHS21_24570 [Cohnella abietis]